MNVTQVRVVTSEKIQLIQRSREKGSSSDDKDRGFNKGFLPHCCLTLE